jgi:uncharacterized protein YbjT (DUF2867 family)
LSFKYFRALIVQSLFLGTQGHMHNKIITVIGGTGFLGRYVVKRLATSGYTIRVLSRHPDGALALKTSGNVGQIILSGANITDPSSLVGKFEDSYAIINLAGILFQSGKQTFSHIHSQGAEKIAQMAKAAGVERFIHVSALGVNHAHSSQYARTKLLGEKAILNAFPTATILRPSVVFGPEDNFYNQFARMASIAPALPLIGGGHTRFQPVYVGDVADAITSCLMRFDALGQTYELGGPHIYSFREILTYILHTTHTSRPLVNIPMRLAAVMGSFSQLLPRPPLTRDQVELLKYDNIVNDGALTFSDLGIAPKAVEIIVPTYLARFHKKAA